MPLDPPFSLEPLLRRYGRRRARMEPMYRQMLAEAQELVTPRRLQQSFPAAALPHIAALVPGAETITLGLCSLGPDLDARVSALFSDDPAAAFVLDEIGTQWIKGLGREMHLGIRADARARGLQTSPSFRPGIGGWPVDLQQDILTRLPAASIGVEMAGPMMTPQKSISMMVVTGARLGRSRYAPGNDDAATP